MYIDEGLRLELDIAKQRCAKNWDAVIVMDGDEGDGKSKFAQQCAFYVDPTFTVDRIAITMEQFKNLCLSCSPGQAIVYDESFFAFDSMTSTNKDRRDLIYLLTMIRKRRLFIIIVAYSYYDLAKYVARHRARILIHVYVDELERGYFRMYDRNTMRFMFKKFRDLYQYPPHLAVKKGRFTSFSPVDEIAYEKKKDQGILQLMKKQLEVGTMRLAKLGILGIEGSSYTEQCKLFKQKWNEDLTETDLDHAVRGFKESYL